jgi:hypothetical protein
MITFRLWKWRITVIWNHAKFHGSRNPVRKPVEPEASHSACPIGCDDEGKWLGHRGLRGKP